MHFLWFSDDLPARVRRVSETPTPTGLGESAAANLYGSTPPICIAVPSWLLSLEERETQQYTSHLYCSAPPICTAVRLPFVRHYFEKMLVVEVAGKFLKKRVMFNNTGSYICITHKHFTGIIVSVYNCAGRLMRHQHLGITRSWATRPQCSEVLI